MSLGIGNTSDETILIIIQSLKYLQIVNTIFNPLRYGETKVGVERY